MATRLVGWQQVRQGAPAPPVPGRERAPPVPGDRSRHALGRTLCVL
jgi:hypothetical protein